MAQEGSLPDTEHYRYDPAANLLDEGQLRQRHNRVTHYKGIHYRYDTFGRTVEKHKDRYRWHYRYDAEHRLTEVIRHSAHYNEPAQHVQFRYDPLGRRTHKQVWLQSRDVRQPAGQRQTTTFLWEGFRLLQETRDGTPLTYVYADQGSYEPLARIDGIAHAQVFYFHNAPNGEPENLTDSDGTVRWQGHSSAWGKLSYGEKQQTLDYSQNLRLQGQYLDRETGLHYNLFRYYDPDIGRFTQHDPIGLRGGINLYSYAPNPLSWTDPLGLSCGIAGSVKWKGFNPKINPKTKLSGLQGHYQKHGHEFGDITQNQYLSKAKDFATKKLTPSMQEAKVGNFVVRHDKSTGEVFVGHMGKREMRTYYKDDGRSPDAFKDAIDLAGLTGGVQ